MATTTDTPVFCTMHWMANGSWSGSETSYIVVLAPVDKRQGDVLVDTADEGRLQRGKQRKGLVHTSSFES